MDARSSSRRSGGDRDRQCSRGGKVVPSHGFRSRRSVNTQRDDASDGVQHSSVTRRPNTEKVQAQSLCLGSQRSEDRRSQETRSKERILWGGHTDGPNSDAPLITGGRFGPLSSKDECSPSGSAQRRWRWRVAVSTRPDCSPFQCP